MYFGKEVITICDRILKTMSMTSVINSCQLHNANYQSSYIRSNGTLSVNELSHIHDIQEKIFAGITVKI